MVSSYRTDFGASGAAQHAIHQPDSSAQQSQGTSPQQGGHPVQIPPPPPLPRASSFGSYVAQNTPYQAAAVAAAAPPAYAYDAAYTQQQHAACGMYGSQPMASAYQYPASWQQFGSQQQPEQQQYASQLNQMQQQLSQLLASQQQLLARVTEQAAELAKQSERIVRLNELNMHLEHEKRALELNAEMATRRKPAAPASASLASLAPVSLASLARRGPKLDVDPKHEAVSDADGLSEKESSIGEDVDLADQLVARSTSADGFGMVGLGAVGLCRLASAICA